MKMKNKGLYIPAGTPPLHYWSENAFNFQQVFCSFFSLFLLVSFYTISYAGRTVDINVGIDKKAVVAANGTDTNNYSTPFVLDSNNNTLNLNAPPRVGCAICGGAGQGNAIGDNIFRHFVDEQVREREEIIKFCLEYEERSRFF
jgi:hypothetical protein